MSCDGKLQHCIGARWIYVYNGIDGSHEMLWVELCNSISYFRLVTSAAKSHVTLKKSSKNLNCKTTALIWGWRALSFFVKGIQTDRKEFIRRVSMLKGVIGSQKQNGKLFTWSRRAPNSPARLAEGVPYGNACRGNRMVSSWHRVETGTNNI